MDGRFMEARRMSNMSKELPKMGNRKQQIRSFRIGIFVKVDEAAAIDETVTADHSNNIQGAELKTRDIVTSALLQSASNRKDNDH